MSSTSTGTKIIQNRVRKAGEEGGYAKELNRPEVDEHTMVLKDLSAVY